MPIWGGYAQDKCYSAVNPTLFTYRTSDVYVKAPVKYENGLHLVSPEPEEYPWESRLENGMPNALVDSFGNVSVYFSSFIVFSPTPPSKVGVMVFTNTSGSFTSWNRPNVGLYWYNPNGTTSDEKISSTYSPGYQHTNIVAVDIESLGIYDDGSSNNPLKLIYMPQREFQYKYLGAYQMPRTFTLDGVLSGFTEMKASRIQNQAVLTFKNINADSHMNWLQVGDSYFFSSRVNGRRSALKPGEVPPFSTDPRKRYRRSTITEVGNTISSKNVDYNVVLDYSTRQWEPYGMQPFRLPGFENDLWFGLVTMYGVDDYPATAMKQRTELAISNNGKDWHYLKPGQPFLDNGQSSSAPDHGCINIATPVYNTKLHASRNPLDPFFFYASSTIGHTEGRNPGLSLAMSTYGKIAGLYSSNSTIYHSPTPETLTGLVESDMAHYSIDYAFRPGATSYPRIIGDITEDPIGKTLTQLNSYASVRVLAYDPNAQDGMGDMLSGSLGSSVPGTTTVSDEYESVPFIYQAVSGNSRQMLINYIKKYSTAHPTEVVSFKNFPEIPIVFEARIKNAVLYGIQFKAGLDNTTAVDFRTMNEYRALNKWSYTPSSSEVHTENFNNNKILPNALPPTQLPSGAIATQVTPSSSANDQTILKMYGDSSNYMEVEYKANGSFSYRLVKEGDDFVNLVIAPPTGQSFVSKTCDIVVEVVKNADRRFNTSFTEETTVMTVSCPDLNFETSVNQELIWNFRRDVPTQVDSSYTRGFAYLPFASFVGDMDTITVGASSAFGDDSFSGTIDKVEISDKLPQSGSIFWPDQAAALQLNRKKRENNEN